MFHGSIPAVIQQMLAETIKTWGVSSIYVGCSGNFTVERALASVGDWSFHGNDVTIFSSTLGAYFANQDFRLDLKPVDGFDFLAPYMGSPVERVATIELATRLVDVMNSKGELRRDNPYYIRIYNAFVKQWPVLHGKTTQKLLSLNFHLASYFNGDVLDFIDQIPPDAPFIVYPPFYAGDYTNMFKKLDFLFDWDKPSFNELNDDLLSAFYSKVINRPYWIIGTDTPQEGISKDYLIGLAQTTNRGVPLHLYGSQGKKRVVVPCQDIQADGNQRLTVGQEVGNHMTLAELTGSQFHLLRSQYMNEKIKPGQETRSFAVLVDGYLIGCFAISTAPRVGGYVPGTVYMLSDFPVAPTDYKRLAKLVLYAALSKEAKLLIERTTSRRLDHLFTTAFSLNPESMKYRGLFKIHTRKELREDERPKYYGNHYMLNYEAQVGGWTLDEGLALWKKKHGIRSTNANTDNQD